MSVISFGYVKEEVKYHFADFDYNRVPLPPLPPLVSRPTRFLRSVWVIFIHHPDNEEILHSNVLQTPLPSPSSLYVVRRSQISCVFCKP